MQREQTCVKTTPGSGLTPYLPCFLHSSVLSFISFHFLLDSILLSFLPLLPSFLSSFLPSVLRHFPYCYLHSSLVSCHPSFFTSTLESGRGWKLCFSSMLPSSLPSLLPYFLLSSPFLPVFLLCILPSFHPSISASGSQAENCLTSNDIHSFIHSTSASGRGWQLCFTPVHRAWQPEGKMSSLLNRADL